MLVKLNIGGTVYCTTQETLNNRGPNMLSTLVAHPNPAQLVEGAYFIDRDPVIFRWLLNYLRGSEILPRSGSIEFLQLREEAEYFAVDGLSRNIQHRLEPEFKSGDNVIYKNKKFTITSHDSKGYIATKLGHRYLLSASESIELVKIEVGDTVMAYVRDPSPGLCVKNNRAPGLCMSVTGKTYVVQMDGQETQCSLPMAALTF